MSRSGLVVKQTPTDRDPSRNAVAIAVAGDLRYALIAKLEAAAAARTGTKLTEVPGAFRVAWVSRPIALSGAPRLRRDVVVSFDYRLPLQSVYRELQRAWPKLRKDGAVRATRPLGSRTRALIEHVCIKMPDASWAERLAEWNAKHKQWRYTGEQARQAFIAAFREAERSLSGAAYGLAYWYDANARLATPKLEELARDGDVAAQREAARRRRAWVDSLREVVDGPEQREVQRGKRKR